MTASSITVPAFEVNLADFLRAYVSWVDGLPALVRERGSIAQATAKPARKPHKQRRTPLGTLLRQAAKAGKNVKGAEVYLDRTVLQFGETTAEPDNSWPLDEFRTKETKQ